MYSAALTLITISLLSLSLSPSHGVDAESPMAFKTIRLENHCEFAVWPVISEGSSVNEEMKKFPFTLQPGDGQSVDVNAFWGGSIWGRAGCTFNNNVTGIGQCNSGDCGGKQFCNGATVDVPTTKATFEFLGGVAKPDTFSVTLENGYNLPISVIPANTSGDCASMECVADVESVCPKNLLLKAGDEVGRVFSSCKGGCDGYECSPSEFGIAFQKACPRAFPFSQRASICPPSVASYTLSFCPPSGS